MATWLPGQGYRLLQLRKAALQHRFRQPPVIIVAQAYRLRQG
ncbi:hypothetical protein [Thermogemmatispora sp.]|jgi:hypothetical protein|nr:hypothetical protein [Thermogemmatispora sp.]